MANEFITSNYVKFARGTSAAWEALEKKSNDTIYFISDDNTSGKLYFGEKLINCGNSEVLISQISDFLISDDVNGNDILSYDITQGKWVNVPMADLFSDLEEFAAPVFEGATEDEDGKSGIVQGPAAGEQNLFFKGDGTWANPIEENLEQIESMIQDSADQIKEYADGQIQDLKDEQKQYADEQIQDLKDEQKQYIDDQIQDFKDETQTQIDDMLENRVPEIASQSAKEAVEQLSTDEIASISKGILEDALTAALNAIKNSQGSSGSGSGSGSEAGAETGGGNSSCNCNINELSDRVDRLEERATLEWGRF